MKCDKKVECYSLDFSKKYDSTTEARRIMKNCHGILIRIIESKPKFKDILFLIGVSETDGETAVKSVLHTGKRGRPPKIIYGIKKKPHIHLYVFNRNCDSYLLSSFCEEAIKRLKKYNVTGKGANDNLKNAINYIYKQCIYTMSNFKRNNLILI